MKQNQVEYLFFNRITTLMLLIVTTISAYFSSLFYGFLFDDAPSILNHYNIRTGSLSTLAFTGTRWISYWLNACYYAFFNFNATPYRTANLIVHISNGILLWFILSRILPRVRAAYIKTYAQTITFITVALFLLHPVQTQTITYIIQGQLEGLATCATLVLCALLILYAESTTFLSRTICLTAAIITAALATGTKEIAIMAPALLLLLDFCFLKKSKTVWWYSAQWLFLASATATIWSIYGYLLGGNFFKTVFSIGATAQNNLGNIITETPYEIITPWKYLFSQPKVILHYLWIFVWPFNISVEYDWHVTESLKSAEFLVPFCILACIYGYALSRLIHDRSHLLGFAALWTIFVIGPRSSIIPSCELVVDYKTYLASPAILLILAIGMHYIFLMLHAYIKRYTTRYASHIAMIIGISSISLLTCATYIRNQVWQDGFSFWGSMLSYASGKSRVLNNYGLELVKRGDVDKGIEYYKKAILIDPLYRDAYNNLAVAYGNQEKYREAIELLLKLITMFPTHADAYNNLGTFLVKNNELERAIEAFNVAISLKPTHGKAYLNRGLALQKMGKSLEAHTSFKQACCTADLDNETGFLGLLKSSLEIQQYEDAIFATKKLLAINPNHEIALLNGASAYHLLGDYQMAITLLKRLISLKPQDPQAWYNLGEALFVMGDYQAALDAYQHIDYETMPRPQLLLRTAECHARLGNSAATMRILRPLYLHDALPLALRNEVDRILDLT